MPWYYAKHGVQEGPVAEEVLRAKLGSGEVSPDDLVWKEGMEEWKPAGEIPELGPGPVETSGAATGERRAAAPTPGSPVAGVSPSMMTAQPPPGAPLISAPPPTSGMAIASMVCGIVGVMMCYVWALGGIPAVVCGHLALKAIRSSVQPIEGRGMAIAGLVTGYIAIAFQLLFIVFIVGAIMMNN